MQTILCPHGILGIRNCRECQNGYQKKYRKEHPEIHIKYRTSHPESNRKAVTKYQKNHPETVKEYKKKYRKNNPEKTKAERLANYHIPLASNCLRCGSTENLQRAHMDYNKPLDVLILCAKCHSLIDRLMTQ